MLEQLDNSSRLLMYLADELPAGERAQIDCQLAGDSSLRLELETLRAAQDGLDAHMAASDAASVVPGQASGISRITRAMRQHQVRRIATPAVPATVHFWHRMPRWVYPMTAAAAIALVYVGYWTAKSPDPSKLVAIHVTPETSPKLVAQDLSKSDDEQLLAMFENNLSEANRSQDSKLFELRQTENQIADLSQAGDPLQALLTDQPPMPDNE